MLPRSFNSRNEGSPSFEFVSFSGSIKTSSFTIFFDYQNVTGSTHVGKGYSHLKSTPKVELSSLSDISIFRRDCFGFGNLLKKLTG